MGETLLIRLVVGLLRPAEKVSEEKVFRLTQKDVNTFKIIQTRIMTTQHKLMSRSLSGKCIEFDQHVIAFTYALAATNKYLMDDIVKAKLYAVYLTFDRSVEATSYFRITIRNVKTQDAIMDCVLHGLL